MPPEVIPPAGGAEGAPPTPEPNRKAITCECCGSKLDRHGNLLRRGDLAKQMIDAEDTITKLRKDLEKAASTITQHEATIADLRRAAPAERKSLWNRDA